MLFYSGGVSALKKPHSSLVYGSIRPTSGVTPVFFFTPSSARQHAKKPRLFIRYTVLLDPRWDFTTQKVRVANKNHEKSNFVIS